MAKEVTLTIDGRQVTVPEGTLIVNAAKTIGIDIPVFCYHPKMEPVGMCRMCLVEIGRPVRNRQTGEIELNEDGSPKLQFGPKLETACTTPVSEGMVVVGTSEKVRRGRKDIIEFLLTSHPLDCPICDKGGECPLQDLTMGYGPGQSRFIYEEKQRLAKHYPLGNLIVLDRERCILCGRCVRYQDEIVDDPVIGFSQRNRKLQIISFSDPGFDSYFSGNTTDICPVGALTTTDFRFKGRPWELKAAASICSQCPVGCNTVFNVRREASTTGQWGIRRVMPRQNEKVNEIWMCDKGRFGYHYVKNENRLKTPLVRKNGELVPASWDEALELVAARFKAAGPGLLAVASGRLSNEDMFNVKELADGLGAKAALYTQMAGGDLTAKIGVGEGTNFSDMGPETAILVVASDLEEEAPIWYLRIKQAADRGARLIVVNPRPTKLERYATHAIRYPYGLETATVLAMINTLSAKQPDLPDRVKRIPRVAEVQAAAKTFAEAQNAVVLFGSEGIDLDATRALAQACANLLIVTNHTGRANNGLIGVWQRANEQGAWDMGFRPVDNLQAAMQAAEALYVVAANPAHDDFSLAETGKFLVVQDLFLTETAKLADVVLPVQAYSEREGSFTSGERRVQRFYPAVPEPADSLADFMIAGRIGNLLGLDMEDRLASKVMLRIASKVKDYAGLNYQKLSQVEEQWPIVGRGDLYYGGTQYENSQGLGVQVPPAVQRGETVPLSWPQIKDIQIPENGLTAVPINRLYDKGETLIHSTLLQQRIGGPFIMLNNQTAERLGIVDGATVEVSLNGESALVLARVKEWVPENIVLVPRSYGITIHGPTPVQVRLAEQVAA